MLNPFLMGQLYRNNPSRVFDWDKASRLILQHHSKGCVISAGLSEDWFWTGGTILRDGEPTSSHYTCLGSTWATPIIHFSYEDGKVESYECWVWEAESDYTTDTKWPQSALDAVKNGLNTNI